MKKEAAEHKAEEEKADVLSSGTEDSLTLPDNSDEEDDEE